MKNMYIKFVALGVLCFSLGACDPRKLIGNSFASDLPACEKPLFSLSTVALDPNQPRLLLNPIDKIDTGDIVAQLGQHDHIISDIVPATRDPVSGMYQVSFGRVTTDGIDSTASITMSIIRRYSEAPSCVEEHELPLKK